tara:strand:- start:883 stop:1134 length:252 start_codon:yes stop_codon:yes gene_type:complete
MDQVQDIQIIVFVDIEHLESYFVVGVTFLIVHERVQALQEPHESNLASVKASRHIKVQNFTEERAMLPEDEMKVSDNHFFCQE